MNTFSPVPTNSLKRCKQEMEILRLKERLIQAMMHIERLTNRDHDVASAVEFTENLKKELGCDKR